MQLKKYDVVIVGAGHNGLIAGTYLAKKGKKVAVVEKRHCIGGAAVTEELYPGFKFSRASYLLALLRKVLLLSKISLVECLPYELTRIYFKNIIFVLKPKTVMCDAASVILDNTHLYNADECRFIYVMLCHLEKYFIFNEKMELIPYVFVFSH